MKTQKVLLFSALIISSLIFHADAKKTVTEFDMPYSESIILEKEGDTLQGDFWVEEDGLLNISLSSLDTSEGFDPRLIVTLYKDDEEVFSFETEDISYVRENLFRYRQGITEGEYFLTIKSDIKFGDVGFDLDLSFEPKQNTELWGNGSFENAMPIKLSKKYHAGISSISEKDFFKFTMPYDGYAEISMYTHDVKFFSLYDSRKNKIGSIGLSIYDDAKVYEQRVGLSAGDYYISVVPEEDFLCPDYTLEVTAREHGGFEREYNNDKANSTDISFAKQYKGSLYDFYDKDIFSFTTESESDIKIKFRDTYTGIPEHFAIEVSNEEYVFLSDEEAVTEDYSLTLDKGTYYFTIYCPKEEHYSSASYEFEINCTEISKSDKVSGNSDTSSEAEVDIIENEVPSDKEVLQFDDVKDDDWFSSSLLEARKMGLINGMEDNKFLPHSEVSICQVIAMAARLHARLNKPSFVFDESFGNEWYTVYILYAAEHGIISPDDFSVYKTAATRAQTAHIFSGLFSQATPDLSGITIPDVNSSHEYSDDIYKLYGLGILSGNDHDGTFYPERSITRAEAAVILLRIANYN